MNGHTCELFATLCKGKRMCSCAAVACCMWFLAQHGSASGLSCVQLAAVCVADVVTSMVTVQKSLNTGTSVFKVAGWGYDASKGSCHV